MNYKHGDTSALPTPKTLDETIIHMLVTPMCLTRERSYHVLRDFISQKFGIAFLKAGDNEELLWALQSLYADLIQRDTITDKIEPL